MTKRVITLEHKVSDTGLAIVGYCALMRDYESLVVGEYGRSPSCLESTDKEGGSANKDHVLGDVVCRRGI